MRYFLVLATLLIIGGKDVLHFILVNKIQFIVMRNHL